jgi:serine protease AprX
VYRSQYDVFTIGAGYLDILAALTEHSGPLGPALSPSVHLDSQTGQVVVTVDSASAWMVTGGLSAAWGSAVFVPSSASAAWGSSAAWGNSAAWGSSAGWGSSVAWGHSAAWGSSAGWGSSLPPMTEN